MLQPVGGHNRNLSTNCIINLLAESGLSLAILHLQLTGVERVTVTVSDNSTNITEAASYPQLGIVVPGNNYVDYGSSVDLLHLDSVSSIAHQFLPEHIFQVRE